MKRLLLYTNTDDNRYLCIYPQHSSHALTTEQGGIMPTYLCRDMLHDYFERRDLVQ